MIFLKNYAALRCSLTLVLLFSAFLGRTQNIWLDHNENSITLDLNRPFFEGDENFTFPSLAFNIYGRYSVSEKVTLVADLPFAYSSFSFSGFGADESENNFVAGNMYLGAEIASNDKSFTTELGIRIPTATDDNIGSTVLVFSNYDRTESYVSDFMDIGARGNYFLSLEENLQLRLRGGANLLIFTGGEEDIDSELLADYAGQFIYSSGVVNAKFGISGQAIITESDLDFDERVVNSLGLAVDFDLNGFTPGVGVKLPLDQDVREIIDAVLSVNFTQKL